MIPGPRTSACLAKNINKQTKNPTHHPASSDTDRIGPIPPAVPEHFCDPALGLSGNYDMLPWHSLGTGGICPLVDDPRRNTKMEEKEHDWPSREKSPKATHTQNQGMKMARTAVLNQGWLCPPQSFSKVKRYFWLLQLGTEGLLLISSS